MSLEPGFSSAHFRRACILPVELPPFDDLWRPAERDQFVARMARCRIERHRLKIGVDGLADPSLNFQGMPELQMSVGRGGVEVDRCPVGRFRRRDIPRLLRGMAVWTHIPGMSGMSASASR